jgi:putative ABC transport system permease protein
MRRLAFYIHHALTNLRHSGHWTVFAIFCVAAGVATVVALRSLGLAITDSLLSNLRQYNHGDINLSAVSNFGPFAASFNRGADERQVFTDAHQARVQEWISARGGYMTAYTLVSNVQVQPWSDNAASTSRPQFTSSFLIDPTTFDLAAPIYALEPAGVPLAQLFTGGPQVVISQNLAEEQQLQVGDAVRVSGTETPFTITGIVATESEASVNNILAAFFGFMYFDRSQAALLQLNPQPNTFGLVLPEGTPADAIDAAALEAMRLVPVRDANATPWLLERNTELADMIARFIVAMGLGALLIGGVGIMNTMLVLVGRRTYEIAALKTFGLKGAEIARLFLMEAFIIGVVGSLIGMVGGLGLSLFVNQFGETFLQQRLPWRIHPEALLFGLVLGLVVTMVFGVLPVLTASRVRPALVLRPNENTIPRASQLQVLLSLLVIVVVLGIITGQIIGPVVEQTAGRVFDLPPDVFIGMALVAGTLLLLGILVGLLWLLVTIIGRLPAPGWVDLRLALRNLASRRLRTATTLLALSAGMFALSSISTFGLGAREVVRFQFAQTLGGNVMVVPLVPEEIMRTYATLAIQAQPGVDYETVFSLSLGRVAAVDGETLELEGMIASMPLSIMMRDTDNPELASGPLLAGRDLTAEDRGQPVIVLAEQSAVGSLVQGFGSLEDVGITVGSRVSIRAGGGSRDYEVVGIVGNTNRFTPNIANAYVPPDAPGIRSRYPIHVVQVQPEAMDVFLRNMQAVPLLFALDVSFVDGLLSRLIDQLAAIPTIVGLLSLLAAAVIMANTVSLTMLERRQQIGVLKVLGLQRGRVLRIVLLENTIIGLLGGLLGIGLSALLVSVLTGLGTGLSIPIPSEATWITVGLVVAAVGIAWVATLLSARVAIGESVARILRYE